VEFVWHRAKKHAVAGQGSKRPPIGGSPWHERRTPIAQPTQIASKQVFFEVPIFYLEEKFDIEIPLSLDNSELDFLTVGDVLKAVNTLTRKAQ
jgi:hypothetical protein